MRRHDHRAADHSTSRRGIAALAVFLLIAWAGTASAQQMEDMPGPEQLETDDSADVPEEPSADSEEPSDDQDDEDEPSDEESADAESSQEETAASEGPEETAEEDTDPSTDGDREQETTETESPRASEETQESPDAEQPPGDEEAAAETDGEGEETKEDTDTQKGKLVNREESVERKMVDRDQDDRNPDFIDAGVNSEGVPGFRNVTSAQSVYPRTFNVAFNSELTGGQNVVRQNDTNQYVAGRLTLHAQIIEYFSANIGLGARNNVNTFGRPQAMLSQGDAFLGLRGHYSPTEFLHLGGDLSFDFPTGFGSAGIDFSGTSVRPRLLGTLELNPLVSGTDLPIRTHLNVGYRFDNTANTVPSGVELTRVERFAHDVSAFDRLEMALGAEYDLPYVSPFVAWRLDIPVNPVDGTCGTLQPLDCPANAGFASFPDRISLGARAEPIEQLGLHAGIDLGLTARDAQGVPVTPPYKVFFGASWKIDPRPKIERVTKTIVETREAAPPRAHLAGKIVDQKSGDPVGGASIAYPNLDRSPQMSGEANGEFRSYGLEPGTEVALRIDHPKYHAKDVTKKVEEEGDVPLEVELEPKPQKGTITGAVRGAGGGPLADAVVRFAGPETLEVRADSAGEFEAQMKEGSYEVGAVAPDRAAGLQQLDVDAGGEHSLTFELAEGPGTELVNLQDGMIELDAKIEFQSGSADMAGDSRDKLDQVAAFLRAHPEVQKVEVQGHTDDVGNKQANMELSQRRADTVRDYLVEQGVSADRLVSEGYGPTKPLVPNISDANRRKNRRVDFKVLER